MVTYHKNVVQALNPNSRKVFLLQECEEASISAFIEPVLRTITKDPHSYLQSRNGYQICTEHPVTLEFQLNNELG